MPLLPFDSVAILTDIFHVRFAQIIPADPLQTDLMLPFANRKFRTIAAPAGCDQSVPRRSLFYIIRRGRVCFKGIFLGSGARCAIRGFTGLLATDQSPSD